MFEEGASILERSRRSPASIQACDARQIDALEGKLRERNEVLAEMLVEYVALKKTLATLDPSPFGIGIKAVNPSRRNRDQGL